MTRQQAQILIALVCAVALGTWAAFATRNQITSCMGPRLTLALGADGEATLADRHLGNSKDLAAALSAAAAKKPQPVVDISALPQTSRRTIASAVTLVRTAGIKCIIVPGTDSDFSGI